MWRARVAHVNDQPHTDSLDMRIVFEQTDELGAILSQITKDWHFTPDSLPSPEVLSQRIADELAKIAALKAQTDLYAGLTEITITDAPSPFPCLVSEMSPVEVALRQIKDAVKPVLVAYIQANPQCVVDDLYQHVLETMGESFGHMVEIMVPIYAQGAYAGGLIPAPSFEALRDWVAVTPVDELMAV